MNALGMVEAKLKKADSALADFQRAVDLQPNSSQAHLNLGIALADEYQLAKALEEFSKAESLSPETAAPRYNRGRLLVDLNRYDEAVPELRLACERSPKFAASFYLLGLANTKLGNYEDAASAFAKFLKLEPQNADAYFLAGQDLQRLGRMPEAIEYWKKAVAADANQTEALYNLWRALAKTDSPDAAIYQERFKRAQKDKQIVGQAGQLGNFALASANRGDYQAAIAQFQQAVKECGDCNSRADLFKDLGLIECKSGDLRHGEEHLLLAKSLKPDDPDIAKALTIVSRIRSKP
jgi:tetratricopeptide (TPR) repeat protein